MPAKTIGGHDLFSEYTPSLVKTAKIFLTFVVEDRQLLFMLLPGRFQFTQFQRTALDCQIGGFK